MRAMDIAVMTDNVLKSQAFKLKGRLYTLTVLSVFNANSIEFARQLKEVVVQAPKMFHNMPIVLDLSTIELGELDLKLLCQTAREYGLVPVAIQSGDARLETLAQCLGLAVLSSSSNHDKPIQTKPKKEAVKEIIKSKLLTTPVRSGQQVVSKGDLVITAAVSHGAELLADGHIHVYGPLRGRALAGIAGNKQARIFCHSLEAELVSIAGFYRLSDSIEPLTGPCQIFLQDDHIQIEPI